MKKDKRAQKTKDLLAKTLIKLLLTKPLKDITVTELTSAADLNRATFYLHYESTIALFRSIENDLYFQVQEWISAIYPQRPILLYFQEDSSGNITLPILTEVFSFIAANKDTTTVLLRNPESRLLTRIYSDTREIMRRQVQESDADVPLSLASYSFDYVVNGCIGIIERWIGNDLDEDPATMSALTCKLVLQNHILNPDTLKW